MNWLTMRMPRTEDESKRSKAPQALLEAAKELLRGENGEAQDRKRRQA